METIRDRYRPSGGVAPVPLLISLLVLAAAMAVISLGLYAMLMSYYLAFIGVVFPGLAVVACCRRAIRWSQCRSRIVAGILCASCGLVAYLGYFHLDQCLRWRQPWTALNQLPQFIAYRMETDQWEAAKLPILSPAQPKAGVQPVSPVGSMQMSPNWVNFGYEAAVLTVWPLIIALFGAGIPYSELRRKWMCEETLCLQPKACASLRSALDGGSLEEWIAVGPKKVGAHEEHRKVSLWYLPAESGAEPETLVYVEAKPAYGWPQRYWLLQPEEAALFVELFPGLQEMASAADVHTGPADADGVAQCWRVPPPFAGQFETPRNQFVCRLITWATLLLPPVIPCGALVGGTYLFGELASRKLIPEWCVIAHVVGVGIGSLFLIKWMFNPQKPLWARVRKPFQNWLLRRTFADRPDVLVGAQDPHAILAEMCPRRLWTGLVKSRGLSSEGLLLIDDAGRRLLFEGDFERYIVPAQAIVAASIEAIPGVQATLAAPYVVVLLVRTAQRSMELPFYPQFNLPGQNNWERAVELLERIEVICERQFPRGSPPPSQSIHVV